MENSHTYEKIGCDKINFRGFEVLKMNLKDIESRKNVCVDHGGTQDFRRLSIVDGKMFHALSVERRYEEGILREETCLSIRIGEIAGNNLNLWSVNRYKKHLLDLSAYLLKNYNLAVDFSQIRISTIEIGCNITLSSEYSAYQRSIRFIFNNLPKTLKLEMAAKKEEELESCIARNRQREFTIYNKRKELEDKQEETPEEEVMRIEYRLRTGQKVNETFNTDFLADITNDMIEKYFISTFQKEIANAYLKWKQSNKRTLMNLVKELRRANPRRWQDNLLTKCRNSEQEFNRFLLLDIEDLFSVLKELEKNGNFRRTQKAIMSKLEQPDAFAHQSGEKISEIIDRVTLIYDSKKKE